MSRRRKVTSSAEFRLGSRVVQVEGWRADLVLAPIVAVVLVALVALVCEIVGVLVVTSWMLGVVR